MSLNVSRQKLSGALADLLVAWDQVTNRWDDGNARQFEKRHLAPLEPKIRNAVQAMEKMDEALRRARRDCGP